MKEKYNIHDLQSLPIVDLVDVLQRFEKNATKKQELVKRIV